MRLLSLFMLLASTGFTKNLPQDMRLEAGSLVMLQQFIDAQANADKSYPVFVNFSCVPKIKEGKISTYKCQIADLKYATKKTVK